MADNEVEIQVVASVDDDEVEALEDKIEDISEESVEVDVSVEDSEVEDATDKATELEDELSNIDGQEVSINVDASGLDEANESLQETEASIDSLKTAIIGLVATAEVDHMATVADNINNSWNRLELTFEGTGVAMDDLKDKVSQVSAETSRSGGTVRSYFNLMGVAGVTNTQLLASSFVSLSGKAYQLETSVESLEGKMQTMVLTGNASEKMLKNLGLSAQDLANAIGVSVDDLAEAFDNLSPEQRLDAITRAMGDGARANEMYGDSYEAMKAKADASIAGLEGAVGQAILPTVIPALDAGTLAVKGLTEAFKELPEPVQGAIGTTLGVSAIATTGIGMFGEFAGAIANLGDAYGVLKGVYEALIPVEIAEGIAGNFSISWMLIAIAIGIALGLALIYLYNHSERFRNAVQWLGNKLQWLSNIIVSNITNAVNRFSEIVQGIPRALQACLDWAYNIVMSHPLVQALIWLGNQAVRAFSVLGLGQSSPGKIVKAMKQELDWTSEAIYNSDLASDTARLGSDVANSFRPNLSSGGVAGGISGGSGGDTVINIYGDVDSDKRVQQIIDVIRNELEWNNTTAGRVV